ncbi:hypothetical protein QTN25_010202 [Entamoeba marina]
MNNSTHYDHPNYLNTYPPFIFHQKQSDVFDKQHDNQIERPNCKDQWRIVNPLKEPLTKKCQQTNRECWGTDVLWNEEDAKRKKPEPLYLDLNDTGLLLTEAVVPLGKQTEIEKGNEIPPILETPKSDEENKEVKTWKMSNSRLENLSNDRYYFMGKTGYTQKKFIIYHSKPAATHETF